MALLHHQQVDEVIDGLCDSGKSLDTEDLYKQLCTLFRISSDGYTWDQNSACAREFCDEHYAHGVFGALKDFVERCCVLKGNEVVCKFDCLLRWHEMATYLTEDLLVCTFWASKEEKPPHYAWTPFIDTDNEGLNGLLGKELADIHAHLKGSSLNFDVNWMCLMNHIDGREDVFENIQKELLNRQVFLKLNTGGRDFWMLSILAAAIRMYLFSRLADAGLNLEKELKQALCLRDKFAWFPLKREIHIYGQVLRECYGYGYTDADGQRTTVYDYAQSRLSERRLQGPDREGCAYSTLAGERYILYGTLKRIFNNRCTTWETTLFYIYLLIKHKVRHELIQTNEEVGFSNFQNYQKRKTLFVAGYADYSELLEHLSVASLFAGHDSARWHETRIAPADKCSKCAKYIEKLDRSITNRKLKRNEEVWQYGYIYHFIKQPDRLSEKTDGLKILHEDLRKRVRLEVKAIVGTCRLERFRPSVERPFHRIVGVDAASSEIGCRPEVFAQAFRYVRNLGSRLGITYHVGEDFYDILDGLRAIDECVLFMEYGKGDRLGHALALGIDPERYFRKRKFVISMPKQVALDNYAWLFMQLRCKIFFKHRELAAYVHRQYEKLFKEIYGEENGLMIPSVECYYHSWMLRGDAPERYCPDGSIDNNGEVDMEWCQASFSAHERVVKARKDVDARRLYYRYHHDDKVKKNGSKMMAVKYPVELVKGIGDVQRRMLGKVRQLGLAIECNPTSNYKIGDIDRYDEHPILHFCPDRLILKPGSRLSCSINTDDKGVFATSIEREYAIMAAAISRTKGNRRKDIVRTLKWLDSIRENSLKQKFIKKIDWA